MRAEEEEEDGGLGSVDVGSLPKPMPLLSLVTARCTLGERLLLDSGGLGSVDVGSLPFPRGRGDTGAGDSLADRTRADCRPGLPAAEDPGTGECGVV